MKPAFETENLRVWKIIGKPNNELGTAPRHMYVATLKNIDWPGIVVSCSIWIEFENWVDWIEVATPERNRGYATELIKGIEARIGQVTIEGVSGYGKKLEYSFDRSRGDAI